MNRKNSLELAEIATIGLSIAGSVAATISGQLGFVLTPLTLTFSLNWINRQRLEQQLQQVSQTAIAQVENQARVLLASQEMNTNNFAQQLTDLERKINTINNRESNHFSSIQSVILDSNLQLNETLKYALKKAQERLIIVSPWLRKQVFDELRPLIEEALERGVKISIGFGYNSDWEFENLITLNGKCTYHRQNDTKELYGAIPQLKELSQKDLFTFKLLGTHEKFLVCDSSFAVVGSYNFLSCGTGGKQREIGVKLYDPCVIKQLIENFDQAPDLRKSKKGEMELLNDY